MQASQLSVSTQGSQSSTLLSRSQAPRTPSSIIASRHPLFYFEDGTVIFQAADLQHKVLFKVHVSLLMFRSRFFAGLLSIPRDPNATTLALATEGKDDCNPILLPAKITPSSFEDICTYIYIGPSKYPDSEQFLINILHLSTFLEIEDGVIFAVSQFERRQEEKEENFDPALQFALARLHGIDQWIEKAFRRLMKLPLTELTLHQAHLIGDVGFFHLNHTKAQIDILYKTLAFGPPPTVHDLSCYTHFNCSASWGEEWAKYSKNLVHPDQMVCGEQICDHLRAVLKVPGMCEGCQKLTITALIQSGHITKDEELIKEAIRELMLIQTDEAIRTELRTSVTEQTRALVGNPEVY